MPKTGDPWAALSDVERAAMYVEDAINPDVAALPGGLSGAGANLSAAIALLGHASSYYATAGYTDLSDEASAVMANLSTAATSGATGQGLYAVLWGIPVRYGSLAHLWRRARDLTAPFPSWLGWTSLGIGVVGLGLSMGALWRDR